MRPIASAAMTFAKTPSGARWGVEYEGAVFMLPDDGLAALAGAETGFTWVFAVGEVAAERHGYELAVSSPSDSSGVVSVSRGGRVVFEGRGDLAEVLRAASAWR